MKFVDREEVLLGFPALARQILDWQSEVFILDEFSEGEEVYLELDDDEPATLTAEMARELNLEAEANLDRLRDTDPGCTFPTGPKSFMIAEPPGKTLTECIEHVGKNFEQLAKSAGLEEMAILPMSRAPILSQENDFPEASKATNDLKALGLDTAFEGGIVGDVSELTALVGPLFWIARCNACAPYVSFGFKESSIVGTFCKYINFHFEIFDPVEAEAFDQALQGSGYFIPEDSVCDERFAKDGAISGRRISLS